MIQRLLACRAPFWAAGLIAIAGCTDPESINSPERNGPLFSSAAAEFVSTFEYFDHMIPIGFSARLVPLQNGAAGAGLYNTDLAFWGTTAYQGTFEGFRIIDITAPARPREIINYTDCTRGSNQGNHGDLVVWDRLLVRSWNSPVTTGAPRCGGQDVPAGFEGIHVFDVSNPVQPVLVGSLQLACGSKSSAGVPDLNNNRLLIYSTSASGFCRYIDIIEIPLDRPQDVKLLRLETVTDECQDIAVILGATPKLACSHPLGASVFSLGGQLGSLEHPAFLHEVVSPDIFAAKGVAWTWDGKVLVIGNEASSGTSALCQASSDPLSRSVFFFDASSGARLGVYALPRDQLATENCTWNLFNVVPVKDRYVLVGGNFQAGVIVVDFTNPASAVTVAFADPATLVDPDSPHAIEFGGDWSAYWYNGHIYESDLTRGLIIWTLADGAVAGASRLEHLNPQTIEKPFR